MKLFWISFIVGCIIYLLRSIVNSIIVRNNAKLTDYSNLDPDYTESEYQQSFNVYDSPIIKEHYANVEKIRTQYKVVYNLKEFHGELSENLINLCERDIEIAPEFVRLLKEYNKHVPPSYYTFKQLAILYERRKDFEEGVDICIKAIRLGFTDDGEMYGRLARLLKKAGYEGDEDNYANLIQTIENLSVEQYELIKEKQNNE